MLKIKVFSSIPETNVLKVQVQPKELNYNGDGMISCFISLNTAIGPDTSVITVKWYHNNEQLNSAMDLQQLNATYIESNIALNNIQVEDAGDYTCNVSIGNDNYVLGTQSVCVFGKFYNFSNNFYIYSELEGFFSIETSSYTNLMIGSRAVIQCGNVIGVNYTWRGPTNEILADPLTISSVSVSDGQSSYTCTANVPSNPMNCQTQVENIALEVIGMYLS